MNERVSYHRVVVGVLRDAQTYEFQSRTRIDFFGQLNKLAELRERSLLKEDEFNTAKAILLATITAPAADSPVATAPVAGFEGSAPNRVLEAHLQHQREMQAALDAMRGMLSGMMAGAAGTAAGGAGAADAAGAANTAAGGEEAAGAEGGDDEEADVAGEAGEADEGDEHEGEQARYRQPLAPSPTSPSHPIPSQPTHPIPSHSIPLHLIPSHPIPSHPTPPSPHPHPTPPHPHPTPGNNINCIHACSRAKTCAGACLAGDQRAVGHARRLSGRETPYGGYAQAAGNYGRAKQRIAPRPCAATALAADDCLVVTRAQQLFRLFWCSGCFEQS